MSNKMRCPRCQCAMTPIEVHGHLQCEVCKSNVQDCCQGETCASGFVDAVIKDEPTGKVTRRVTDTVMEEAIKHDKQPL